MICESQALGCNATVGGGGGGGGVDGRRCGLFAGVNGGRGFARGWGPPVFLVAGVFLPGVPGPPRTVFFRLFFGVCREGRGEAGGDAGVWWVSRADGRASRRAAGWSPEDGPRLGLWGCGGEGEGGDEGGMGVWLGQCGGVSSVGLLACGLIGPFLCWRNLVVSVGRFFGGVGRGVPVSFLGGRGLFFFPQPECVKQKGVGWGP